MNTSKIKTLANQGTKDWNGKTLVKWFVVFENGENGTYTQFPDNEDPAEGQEMTYEIKDNGYGPEIKTQKKGGSKGGGGWNKKSPEETAMINTIAITKSAVESGQLTLPDIKSFVISFHTFFMEYNNGDTKAPAETQAAPVAQKTEDPNDLPF